MLRRAAGPIFVIAGAMHFVVPKSYMAMMPRYLPAHRALVYASGVAEIAGGAGLMHPRTRSWAGWWLIATLAAVFPANLNMALNPDRYAQDIRGGRPALIARLPLQAALIAWVHAAAHDGWFRRSAPLSANRSAPRLTGGLAWAILSRCPALVVRISSRCSTG